MRRDSEPVRNRLRQQAGNLDETTQSLARPVPYRFRLLEFLAKATPIRCRILAVALLLPITGLVLLRPNWRSRKLPSQRQLFRKSPYEAI